MAFYSLRVFIKFIVRKACDPVFIVAMRSVSVSKDESFASLQGKQIRQAERQTEGDLNVTPSFEKPDTIITSVP